MNKDNKDILKDESRWEKVQLDPNYGISRWEKADRINERLENMRAQPIYDVNDDALKGILDFYDNKCGKSKEITTKAKEFIPGGVQHNLAFNYPFPICVTQAKGAYMTDMDGNKYIDFLQAGGPTILGSNNDVVRTKIKELLDNCGPVTGLFHEAEYLIASEINKHMPNVEKFRMLGSGTESAMAAVRVARCATGKKRLIKVGGAYHGWSDQMVYGLKVPGTRNFLESYGIPSKMFAYIDEVRPNDLDMLEHFLKRNKSRGGTCAVLIEPVGPESGTRPVDYYYNQAVRQLCDKYGCLFIMDEVVTGFRVGLGGSQGFFNVKPDLTIFGKIVAGGYPAAGGVGGKKEYVDCMAAGVASGMKRAYVGGTLAANPMSALAGYLTIKEIEKTNACVKAGQAGDRLADGLQTLVEKYSLPFVVYNQGSIVHLECAGAMSYDFSSYNVLRSMLWALKQKPEIMLRKVAMEHMGAAYMSHGLVSLAGSRLYTSLADTDEVIDEALNRFDDVFALVEKGAPTKIILAEQKAVRDAKSSEKKATKKANQAKWKQESEDKAIKATAELVKIKSQIEALHSEK
ncbi:MAG: aminotransferase class III-fold pyridoxal phosphate-dependent enzyme [Clostridia bacterium]